MAAQKLDHGCLNFDYLWRTVMLIIEYWQIVISMV